MRERARERSERMSEAKRSGVSGVSDASEQTQRATEWPFQNAIVLCPTLTLKEIVFRLCQLFSIHVIQCDSHCGSDRSRHLIC